MNRPDCITENVPIGPMTTLEVGGPARYFASCESAGELTRVLEWSRQRNEAVFVLGGGSNVLVADSGFDGLVVKCANTAVEFQSCGDDVSVRADAGVDWDEFVATCVDERLAGIECLSGIPGLLGAAPIQNIGAYGQEVVDTIVSVTGVDMRTLRTERVPASECGFGYRSSVFKSGRRDFVVTCVEFRLKQRDAGLVAYPDLKKALGMGEAAAAAPTLAETRSAVLQTRSEKSMVIRAEDPNRRSAGSFFINPLLNIDEYETLRAAVRRKGMASDVPSFPAGDGIVKVPAAWLIEQAGYKRGMSDGAVGLSSKHALAVINKGGATANDIVRFAAKVREAVRAAFGVSLSPEPVLVGFDRSPEELFGAGTAD